MAKFVVPLNFSLHCITISISRKHFNHNKMKRIQKDNLIIKFLNIVFNITSPAPWKRKTLSLSFLPVIFNEANTPAAATDAVPVLQNQIGS